MSSNVTVMEADQDIFIDQKGFYEWLDAKGIEWWNDRGLCVTAEVQEGDLSGQDDEFEIREVLSEKIDQFNDEKMLTTDGDVAWISASVSIICEYLKDECDVVENSFEQGSGDNCVIFRSVYEYE